MLPLAETLAESGGAKDVVAAMDAYRCNLGIQLWACQLFGELAKKVEPGPAAVAAVAALVSHGVIAAIVAAMKAHRDNMQLQLLSVLVMVFIAGLDNFTAPIMAAGGLPVVLSAMRAFPPLLRVAEQRPFDRASLVWCWRGGSGYHRGARWH